jgi:hypothetical protein
MAAVFARLARVTLGGATRPPVSVRAMAKKAGGGSGGGKKGRQEDSDDVDDADVDTMRNPGKGGKSGKGAPATATGNGSVVIVEQANAAMKEIVKGFGKSLGNVRHSSPGRPHGLGRYLTGLTCVDTALLEGLDVEVNGKMTPLGRLGQVGIKDKSTLSIMLFDPEVCAGGVWVCAGVFVFSPFSFHFVANAAML